jgi:phosphoglycerate dehydrogenase-like enzyme
MPKPIIAVLAGRELFSSFFDEGRQRRLSRLARWELVPRATFASRFPSSLQGAQALITTWDSPYLSVQTAKCMPSLKMIAHCGGEVKKRYDESLFKNLTIVNTAEPMARPTAELGATFLLYAARNVDYYRAALRKPSNRIYDEAHVDGGIAESMLGREVGMIGFGRVARALVEMMRGFNVRWRVYDPYASKALAAEMPVTFDSLNGVLRRSSLLMVAASLTAKTQGILSSERLSRLPDGAVLINIARGGLVDLAALTHEVASGRLRCALDVTDPEEPLPLGHPLRTLQGAITTPHIGGGGRKTRGEMADVAMEELERFFAGMPVKHRVTTKMLNRMT